MGSWRGTQANDNLHWAVASTATGIDMQLNLAGVSLNGANKLIIQTEVDMDATVPNLKFQICDWTSTTGVDNAADAQCTGGGWRSLNTQTAANADVNYTDTAGDELQFHIYDGYFTTATTGGTTVSTPLTNFVSSGNVKIRYYSTINTTSVVSVDYLRVFPIVDSIYHPAGITNQNVSGGALVGTYASAVTVGNSATGQLSTTTNDAVYVTGAGTAGSVADYYVSFKNIKTLTGMNSILVRADYSCSAVTGNIIPQIRNFNASTWENLTSATVACSTTDAINGWAVNNVTLSNYISSGEIRIRWSGSANGTHTLRLDEIYVVVGSTNTDTAQCGITMGTGTATNCTNTRTLDMNATASTFDNPAEDETTTGGTGLSNSLYAMDNESTPDATLEEATSANINFPMTLSADTQVVGQHYAGRFTAGTAGATALTVQMGIRDYAGLNSATGGWTQVGTTATSSAVYTDSMTALTNTLYGNMANPDDHIDTVNNIMNVRLRPTAAGTAATNATTTWDFAMVSLQWVEDAESPTKRYQFSPTGQNIILGTDNQNVNSGAVAAIEGINMGSWRGTLTDDNLQWIVSSTTTGVDMQLITDGVESYGANKIIIQTEIDLDATVPNLKIQLCDWVNTTGVDNAADAQCTGGGWRSLNSQTAANADVDYTDTAGDALQFHVYDGYFTTGTAGGTSITTPIANFISADANKRVLVRYFATTNTTSTVVVDFLRITVVVDSIYSPATVTNQNVSGGALVGTYASAQIVGNVAAGIQTLATGDGVYLTGAGTAGSVADFYYTFKNVKTYTGMNSLMVRAEFSCSVATGNIVPQIRNFNSSSWENLSATTIACSATDAQHNWAKNNVTIANYISSGEVWVRWSGSANGTHTLRNDFLYVMLGTTNTDTGTCQVTMGTGTATNCSNTRTIDTNTANSLFDNPTEDESTAMGTGESNSVYGLDTDMDVTVEEGSASNIGFSVTKPNDSSVVGLHYSFRSQGGATNGTNPDIIVQPGLRDYSGANSLTGGWTLAGASSTVAAYVYTDSITALTTAAYGFQSNPEDYVNTYSNIMNVNLRTSTSETSTVNNTTSWDWAMVSLQWLDFSPPASITVSGNAYEDEASTALDVCDGSTSHVAIRVGSNSVTTASCTNAAGFFTFTVTQPTAGTAIVAYIDGTANDDSTTVTSYDGSGDVTFNIRKNRLLITSDNSTAITNANLDIWDSASDDDVVYTVTSSNLVVEDGYKLMVDTSKNYTPGGTVTTDPSASSAAVDGDLHISTGATLTMAANALSVGGGFVNAGTFSGTDNTHVTTFTATSTGHVIDMGTGNFEDLTFNGASGGWSFSDATSTVDDDVIVTAGTLSGTTNLIVNGGGLTGDGAIAMTGGTVTMNTAGSFGGATAWSFDSLTIGGAGNATTTATGAGGITVNEVMTIDASDTLDAGAKTWTLTDADSCACTPLVTTSATLTPNTSTFVYNSTAATNLAAGPFYNLTLDPSSTGSPVYTGSATNLVIGNNFVMGGTNPVTVNYNTNDPSMTLRGNLTINSNATLDGTGGDFIFAKGGGGTQTFTDNTASKQALVTANGSIVRVQANTGTTTLNLTTSAKFNRLVIDASQTFSLNGSNTLTLGATSGGTGASRNLQIGASATFTASTGTVVYAGDGGSDIEPATYYHLILQSPFGGYTYTLGTAGGQLITVGGNFTINGGANSGGLTVDANTWDPILDVNGSFINSSDSDAGVFIASNVSAFTVADDFTNNATFTHSSGTVTFDTTTAATIAGTTTFFNLTSTTGNKTILFTSGQTFTVSGLLTLTGTAGNLITVDATTDGVQWNINHQGTEAVTYVSLQDSGCDGASTVISLTSSSVDNGNNDSCWTWAVFITVSGIIYTDEGSAALDCSTGGNRTVRVMVNGSGSYTADCSLNTGAYSVPSISVVAGNVVTVFLDEEAEDAVAVTRAADGTSNITINLFQNRVIVRHEDAGPTTNANLDQYDSISDADIQFTVTTSNLVVADGAKLLVWTGDTFTPGGTVTTSVSNDGTDSVVDGDVGVQASGILSMGTNALSIGGDFANAGTFSEAGSPHVTTFTATATGHTIDNGTGNLDNVVFNGTAGVWSFSDASNTIADDLTMTAGTLSGTTGVTVLGGDVTGNGTISLTGGTFLVDGAGSFGGNTAWSFDSLTIGGAGNSTTTATGSGAITVNEVMTIDTGDTLNAGSKTWTMADADGCPCTPFVITGVLTPATSTFQWTAAAATNITAYSYNNVSIIPSGTATHTLLGDLTVFGGLTLGNGTNALTMGIPNSTKFILGTGADVTLASGSTIQNVGGEEKFSFTGGAHTLTDNNSTKQNFYGINVRDLNGSPALTLGSSIVTSYMTLIDVTGNGSTSSLSLGANTLTLTAATNGAGSNHPLVIDYDITGASGHDPATFNAGTGTVVFTATSATTIVPATYYNLWVQPAANSITHTAAAGAFVVGNDLIVGSGSHSGIFNLTTNDPSMDINGGMSIDASGTLVASNSASFTIAHNFYNLGTFTHSSGTVTLDGTDNDNFIATNGSNFHNLTVNGSGGAWVQASAMTVANALNVTVGTLSQGATFNLTTGAVTVGAAGTWSNVGTGDVILSGNVDNAGIIILNSNNGTQCTDAANDIAITSSSGGTQRTWSGAGTFTLYNVAVTDMIGAKVAYTSAFTNSNWTNGGCATSISGFIYTDEIGTVLNCSTGGNRTVAIKVDGTGAFTGDCSLNTGAFTVTGVMYDPADVLTLFMDGEAEQANTIIVANTGAMTGVNLYVNRVFVSSVSGRTVTNASLGAYDNDDDSADMLFTANAGAVVVENNIKTIIGGDDTTYVPGGNITTSPSSSSASLDGDLQVNNGSAISVDFANTSVSVGGDYTNLSPLANAGIKASGQLMTFTATSTGHVINRGAAETFEGIVFNGTGGGWSFSDATNYVAADLVMTAGTLSGTSGMNVNGGDVTGNGVINLTGGAFLVNGTGSFGGNTNWIFNNLIFGAGVANAVTTATGSGETLVSGNMNVALDHDLEAGDKVFEVVGSGNASDWWNETWLARRKVGLDNSDSSTNLSNFPILVALDSSKIDYAKVQNAGQDLRFVDSDGSTVLSHEIETWNESGTSYVWVRVPQINGNTANDYIWMYYDNDGASDGQSASAVWSNNYVGVWHLKQAPNASVVDSTGNSNSGTFNNMESGDQGAAKVNGGITFGGTDEFIGTNDIAAMDGASQQTITGWFKRATTADHVIAGKYASATSGNAVELWDDGTAYFNNSNGGAAYGSVAATGTGWFHLANVFNGTLSTNANRMRGYVNGLQQTLSFTGTIASTTPAISGSFDIGAATWTNEYSAGQVDELRVASVARSTDWIQAEYNWTNDPNSFNSFNTEEVFGSSPIIAVNGTLGLGTSTFKFSDATKPVPNIPFYNVMLAQSGYTYNKASLPTNISNSLILATGTTLDLNTADEALTLNGLTVSGTVQASNSANLTITGTFTNNGTFNHNNGTVILQPNAAREAIITGSASNNVFYNLTVNTGGPLKMESGDTLRVTNNLNIQGTTSEAVTLQGTTGSAWTIDFEGASATLKHVVIKNASCDGTSNVIQATSSDAQYVYNGGGNGACWYFLSRGSGEASGGGAGGGGAQGGGGQGQGQATASATTSGGAVTGISVTNAGSGYGIAPAVTVCGVGGVGSGATATATLSGSTVASIAVNSGGSGYSGGATVTIAAPGSEGGAGGCGGQGGGGQGGGGGGSP